MSCSVSVFETITHDVSRQVCRQTSVREMERVFVSRDMTTDPSLHGLWLLTPAGYVHAIGCKGVALMPKWKAIRWRNVTSESLPAHVSPDPMSEQEDSEWLRPGCSVEASALLDAMKGTWLTNSTKPPLFFCVADGECVYLVPELQGCAFAVEWTPQQASSHRGSTRSPSRREALPERAPDTPSRSGHAAPNPVSRTAPSSMAVSLPSHPADCSLVVLRSSNAPPPFSRATVPGTEGAAHQRSDLQLPFPLNVSVHVHGHQFAVDWSNGLRCVAVSNETFLDWHASGRLVALEYRGTTEISCEEANALARRIPWQVCTTTGPNRSDVFFCEAFLAHLLRFPEATYVPAWIYADDE